MVLQRRVVVSEFILNTRVQVIFVVSFPIIEDMQNSGLCGGKLVGHEMLLDQSSWLVQL
jgi:hypothetical protein